MGGVGVFTAPVWVSRCRPFACLGLRLIPGFSALVQRLVAAQLFPGLAAHGLGLLQVLTALGVLLPGLLQCRLRLVLPS